MLEGLYSAAAGLAAQQRRLDAVANDVANVSTTGYKSLRVAFRDLAYQNAGLGAGEGVDTGSGAAAWVMGRSFQQGALKRTDRPLDVALEGPGFLRVRTQDGRIALTRDGNLRIDAQRRLVTSTGLLVEPAVRVPRGVREDQLAIAADGTITAAGRRIGQLRVVDVQAPDGLVPEGDNLFRTSAASGAERAARGTRVLQGVLEQSNVDMADAMVNMMGAQRSYTLASRAIQMQDQAMEIANGIRR